ncbi:response regulator transcription factor [Schumannella sp. 10F1B-5-1]|uniref:response regulator transcription factor n=1 Tax=Schumannella sp. 10F1B-5-1 TaxID=2590780 RepID=UPI00113213F1|nr:response regulator transcription factor [Schumannella sp. 10F1B-5-1]TPW72825.1 response regulator transcription factor [Schumannella sp. 10F1B-5-1]
MDLDAPTDARLRDRRVLVVEDQPELAEVAVGYLRRAGLVVDHAADGFAALATVTRIRPDLVVLDRMMPGVDGLEVCRRLRADPATASIPVLMLTAMSDEQSRIDGLEAGADDYLAKPYAPRELVLRSLAILRRTVAEFAPETVIELGGFRLDPTARSVELDGEQLDLTGREFDLLEFFLKRPNQVFRRDELLRVVWGWTHGDLSTVTVHVRRLREKIERDPHSVRHLATVWGVGYRFEITEATGGVE